MSNILVDDVFVDETNANAIFTVRLDVANANTVTVNYPDGPEYCDVIVAVRILYLPREP
jgi:hypothetical protein